MVQAQGVLLRERELRNWLKAQEPDAVLQIRAIKSKRRNQQRCRESRECNERVPQNRCFYSSRTAAKDARANAEIASLKGNEQTHKRRMDIANILSQRQNQPSGSVAETLNKRVNHGTNHHRNSGN